MEHEEKKKKKKKKSAFICSSYLKRFKENSRAVFSSNSSICPDFNSDICYHIFRFLPWKEYLHITSPTPYQVNNVFLIIYNLIYNLATMNFIQHTQHMCLNAASSLDLGFYDCCIAAMANWNSLCNTLSPRLSRPKGVQNTQQWFNPLHNSKDLLEYTIVLTSPEQQGLYSLKSRLVNGPEDD